MDKPIVIYNCSSILIESLYTALKHLLEKNPLHLHLRALTFRSLVQYDLWPMARMVTGSALVLTNSVVLLQGLNDELIESEHLRNGTLSLQHGQVVDSLVEEGGDLLFIGLILVLLECVMDSSLGIFSEVVVVKLVSISQELLVQAEDLFGVWCHL